jgi:hypothetical protein
MVVRWERLRRQNHWFDAYNACCAGHLAGVRLVEEVKPPPPPQPARRDDVVSDAWMDRLRLRDYPRWTER